MNFEKTAPLFGAWAEKFRPFIESKEMDEIYRKIREDAFIERGGKMYKKELIVPESQNVFRVFKESVPTNIKSIWYLMDPYPRMYKNKALQATGIAMDCSNSPDGEIQPSLKNFYDALDKDLGKTVERTPDLSYLVQQGILLVNTDLTCKYNKTGSHEGLWEPFQKYFLEEVMYGTTGIIYVLSGKSSLRMEKFINSLGNYIFKLEHPAAASHNDTDWNCKNIFKTTNKLLYENNRIEIFWDRKEYQEHILNPPF